jgi:hypothetical protein
MLLLVGGIASLLGIHLAESVYPGYSVSQNFRGKPAPATPEPEPKKDQWEEL